jgi:CBS domain-containing membrane protein
VANKEQGLDADLDAVLARYNQGLDISRDDLKALVAEAHGHAYDGKLAAVSCADSMSRDLVTVECGTSLQVAWALLRDRRIKALPVVDLSFRIAGIITLADFLRAAELDVYEGFDDKLRRLVRAPRSAYVSMHRHLVDLVPLFGSTGHHHIPIIGPGERLVGMITQSDLVAALGPAVDPAA